MSFSFNRNKFVANVLNNLNGEEVLDIGCRDKIFKQYLLGDYRYTGVDYNPNITNDDNDKDVINHNLEQGLPDGKNFDIINALDVLEHVENIHHLFEQMFKRANKKIIIALPNMAYYKFRLNFLFKAEISEKYNFHHKKLIDRHRWITNYKSIINFIEKNKPEDWKSTKFNFIADRKKYYVYIVEKFLAKYFPGLFVYEVIYLFEKKS
tara:strand:- start:438 stop:1061 length:624 start_codon:yes stop_codon:yes gene_type:complete